MWWSKAKKDLSSGVLAPLLLGIAIAQAGIALRNFNILYYKVPEEFFLVVLGADSLMLLGTLLHLIPCWRISHSFSERRIAIEVVLRGVMASTVSFLIVLYNLIVYFEWL
jgi:hypothetical protein